MKGEDHPYWEKLKENDFLQKFKQVFEVIDFIKDEIDHFPTL